MKEQIIQYVTALAPIVAGFITSVLIPLLVEKFSIKHLRKRIEEINEAQKLKEITHKLNAIENEILEMRGKRK